jgi:hypothetical protein
MVDSVPTATPATAPAPVKKTPDQLDAESLAALAVQLRQCGSSIPDLLYRLAQQQIAGFPPPPPKPAPKPAA